MEPMTLEEEVAQAYQAFYKAQRNGTTGQRVIALRKRFRFLERKLRLLKIVEKESVRKNHE